MLDIGPAAPFISITKFSPDIVGIRSTPAQINPLALAASLAILSCSFDSFISSFIVFPRLRLVLKSFDFFCLIHTLNISCFPLSVTTFTLMSPSFISLNSCTIIFVCSFNLNKHWHMLSIFDLLHKNTPLPPCPSRILHTNFESSFRSLYIDLSFLSSPSWSSFDASFVVIRQYLG